MEVLHQRGDLVAERYRITGTLGENGVGITYQAQDLNSTQQVVLKVLSLRRMGEWKALELFEREVQMLSQLDHPAIPRYLDHFEVDTPEDRAFYLVQQLIEGKSLADLGKDGWRPNESEVRYVAEQVLSVLVYLHELNPPVVYRNIKPQNLIRGNDGKIFLVNFGSVTHSDRNTSAKDSPTVETDGYVAPEQFRGQAVPASDLYGLGATVLFLLTHHSPADWPQKRLRNSLRSHIQVSEEFANWLEKMLQSDVEHRFRSAKEALEALQGRMRVARARPSVPWKALVGAGVAAVVAVSVFNSFKWTILGSLGVRPSGICEATESGNLDVVRNYLKQGGDPYAKDESDRLLLRCLLNVKNGTRDIAKLVVAKLPDVNAKDNQGKTLLHVTDWTQMAEALIAAGADVNAKDKQGNTPLDRAIEVIYQSSPPSQYSPQKQIEPPQEQIDLAKLLIAKGARFSKVNSKDKEGRTLLHKTDSKQVAELLIAAGADVNAKDKDANTPLLLVRSKDMASLLIAAGADVNAKDKHGNTPLHRAVGLSEKEMVEQLIARGADVNAKDLWGNTPLHDAILNGTRLKQVAELLIGAGADVNAKDNRGVTPLHLARSKETAKLLIDKGADVNAKTNDDDTPLEWAGHRACDVVELLKNHGGKASWVTLCPGEKAHGLEFTEDRTLSYQGKVLLSKIPVSYNAYGPISYARQIIVSNPSPSGNFSFFKACDGSLCWALFFVDKQKRKLNKTNAGKYGPNTWVQWSRDERYAILASENDGAAWIHAIDMKTGNSRVIKEAFQGAIKLNSFSWINDREFKIKIIPYLKNSGFQQDTASSFWWRGNIEKDTGKD
jgi:ankyrin repeat protein